MKKLIYFELRKIFSKRLSMVTLIGILLFSALLSFSTYQNKYAFDQNAGEGSGKAAVEIDKEIAAKYEGILTDEKVRQMMSDFAPTSDLHGLNAAYIYQNAMQSAAFSRFSDLNGNWNGLSVSDVFGNEEIKIGYSIQQKFYMIQQDSEIFHYTSTVQDTLCTYRSMLPTPRISKSSPFDLFPFSQMGVYHILHLF